MTSGTRSRNIVKVATAVVFLTTALAGYVVWFALAPSPAQPHIEEGLRLMAQTDSAGAQREWLLATRADPSSAEAWTLLGQCYLDGGHWAAARDALESTARLAPETERLHSVLATCAFRMGDTTAAEKYAVAELSRNPNDVPALEVAAAVQAKRGDAFARLLYLRRLSQVRPNKVEYLRALAEALYTQKSMADLIPVTDQIIALEPSDSDAWALRGEALFATDRSPAGLARSQNDLRRGAALGPNRFLTRLTLGRVLMQRRDWDMAIASLQAAVRIRPDSSIAWYELETVWQRKGDKRKAEEARSRYRDLSAAEDRYTALQKTSDASPNDFRVNLETGNLALHRRDFGSARHYLGRAAAIRRGDSGVAAALRNLPAESATDGQGVTTEGR